MKLTRRLFFLFLFLLPTQLGLHFWPSFALVLGRRIDYLSPTLYLTDILLLATAFAFFVVGKDRSFKFVNLKWVLLFFAFLFINVLFAYDRGPALLGVIRCLEVALVVFWQKV